MLQARVGPVLGIVAPVFALVAVGAMLGRSGLISSDGRRDLHRIVFYLAMPAQLVVQLGASDLHALAPATIAVAWLCYLLGFTGTWLATTAMEPGSRGSVLSGTVRSNAALIGVPVALLLADHLPAGEASVLRATALVLLGALVPLFNICSVAGFLLAGHGMGRVGLASALGEVATYPLLLACLSGFAIAAMRTDLCSFGVRAVAVVGRTLGLLGSLAVPASLLLAGAQLDSSVILRRPWLIGSVACAKLVGMPLLGAGS